MNKKANIIFTVWFGLSVFAFSACVGKDNFSLTERILTETIEDNSINNTTNNTTFKTTEDNRYVLKSISRYDSDGKITDYCEYDYSGINVNNEILWRQHSLDELGCQTKDTRYDSDGNIAEYTEYKYDVEYHIISSESTTYLDGKVSLINETTYIYDNGNLSELIIESYHDDNTPSYTERRTFQYDNLGNLLKETFYDNDSISRWIEYEYEFDSQGNCMNETICGYHAESDRYYIFENTYNISGNIVSLTYTSYSGDVISYKSSTTYEYDNLGYLSKEKNYDGDGLLFSQIDYIYRFDNSGNMIEKRISGSSDGEINYEQDYEYIYDEDGKIVKILYSEGEYCYEWYYEYY